MKQMNWQKLLFPGRRLKELGILGMNMRNGDYILPHNQRKNFPLVDNKLLTKKLAENFGIAVPRLYGVIEIEHQIEELASLLQPHQDFVIKPAHGSGGEGILIISGRSNQHYRKLNGEIVTVSALGHHISNILSGMYSLGGLPDKALIEYRIGFDPVFEKISYQGVPDIRTIVFRGVPIMSMVRLPTRLSDGKANLHQGAIGVGIDLCSGRTTNGVWHEDLIDTHPDTGNIINDLQIPYWQDVLRYSARCQEMVGLDYIGVDMVLDAELGPLMLEINARPGVSIQLANKKGLLTGLHKIAALQTIPDSAQQRVALAQEIHDSVAPLQTRDHQESCITPEKDNSGGVSDFLDDAKGQQTLAFRVK